MFSVLEPGTALDNLFGFLQRDGASAQPLFIHLVIGAYDFSARHGDFKIVIPILGFKFHMENRDIVFPVPFYLHVISVFFRGAGVFQRQSKCCLPSDFILCRYAAAGRD